MAHKMILPEDGCLPPISTSKSNLLNNFMIVKVDNLKTPGESTYQLATLDRSKKGTVWPADNYVNKLIPSLTELKIDDEHTKAFESRKELNLSIKTPTVRPKLFCLRDQNKDHSTGTPRPNLARRKNWSDKSQNYNRFCSKPDIDKIQPLLQNPSDNQLCSKKGTVWPADNHVNKLIPSLTELKIDDEHTKAFESRKELNLSIKTATVRPKLFCPPDQNKDHSTGTPRPNLARRKNWSDRSQNYNRFCSKPDIDNIQPWLQNPWDNQLCILPDGSLNLNVFLATTNDRHFNLHNNDFHGFYAPGYINSIHCNLSGAPPSSNGSYKNFNPNYPREDHYPNYSSYNKYRQNSRNGPNPSRHYKNNYPRNASNCGSRHDSLLVEPTNIYIKAEGNSSATNFTCEHSNSANNNIGRIPYISPITFHKNHLPDSRYVPPYSSLEDKYIDQNMNYSVAYDNARMHRNNLNPISYQNSRNRPNLSRYRNSCPRNASNRGSRHYYSCRVEPFNSYLKAEEDNSATNCRYGHGYFANDNIGRIPPISPITLHENCLPYSRYDPPHSSFEDKYIDQEMGISVAYDVGMHRNNSNNIPNQMHYSCAQHNQKQWINNTRFTKPRQNINFSNIQRNINSLNPSGNVNSVSKRNKRRNRNSVQRYVYKKNQRKPSMANNQNFK